MILVIQNDEIVEDFADLTQEQRDDAIAQCEALLKVLKRGYELTPEEFDRVADLIYESDDVLGYTVVDCDGWVSEGEHSKHRIVYCEDETNPGGPSRKYSFEVSRNGNCIMAYFQGLEQTWTTAEIREQFDLND